MGFPWKRCSTNNPFTNPTFFFIPGGVANGSYVQRRGQPPGRGGTSPENCFYGRVGKSNLLFCKGSLDK